MQKSKKIGIILAGIVVVAVGIILIMPRKEELKQDNSQIAFYYSYNGSEIKTETIPEGYILDTYNCDTNNITISWNDETNQIRMTARGGGSCKVYLKWGGGSITLVAALKAKANSQYNMNYNNSSASEKAELYVFSQDGTNQTPTQNTYRYIGSVPNNYIKFNCTNPANTNTCETWRILGIFPVDDGTGTYIERVKLIKEDSIGNLEWNVIMKGDWVNSSLAALLNTGDYYTRSNAYSNIGLTTSAKSIIGPAKWYLGAPGMKNDSGCSICSQQYGISAENLYSSEKDIVSSRYAVNTTIYSVGLMYPSDYLYTYGYGVNLECFGNGFSCYEGDASVSWLSGNTQWFLSPYYGEWSNNGMGNDFIWALV